MMTNIIIKHNNYLQLCNQQPAMTLFNLQVDLIKYQVKPVMQKPENFSSMLNFV